MKKSNIIILILFLILLVCTGLILFLLEENKKVKETKSEETISEKHIVTGVITNIEDNYLIVKDLKEELFYHINFDLKNYDIGDVVAVYSKESIIDSNLTSITPSKIELLKKVEINNTNNQIENETRENNIDNNSSNSSNNQLNESYKEENVVNVFEELNNDLAGKSSSETIIAKIKENFVLCVDFLFYDGEIKGYQFDELTNTAKLKVLQLMMNIDSRIDLKLPGYKETIKNATINFKNKIVEMYLDLTTNICKNNELTCDLAKQGFKDMKDSFGLTWDMIKDFASSGIDKLSFWYQIWKES